MFQKEFVYENIFQRNLLKDKKKHDGGRWNEPKDKDNIRRKKAANKIKR